MKVNDAFAAQRAALAAQNTRAAAAQTSAETVAGGNGREDHIELSSLASQALNEPQVNDERLAELRRQYLAGTYQVDGSAVARAIVADHLEPLA